MCFGGINLALLQSVYVYTEWTNIALRSMKIQLLVSSGNIFCLVFNSQISQYDGSWTVIRIWDFELTVYFYNPWRCGSLRLFITTALALYLRLWQHLCQWYWLIYAIIPARFFLELREVKLRLILYTMNILSWNLLWWNLSGLCMILTLLFLPQDCNLLEGRIHT